jgi:flagellar hook assembly protein FlgD
MPRRKADLAAVVFALLVVATLAAFAYAQRVKRDPLVVDRYSINGSKSNTLTPGSGCGQQTARLKFRTTTSNDGTVEIIRPGGEIVVKLASHEFLKRYTFHTFHWNGRNEDGVIQPPGRYKLRAILEDEERSLTLPGTIHLHKAPSQSGLASCPKKKGSG